MLLLHVRYLNAQRPRQGPLQHWHRSELPRHFSTFRSLQEAQKLNSSRNNAAPSQEGEKDNGVGDDDGGESAFARTEKAAQAAKVNLSARLSKEGATTNTTAGLGEVWRLIKIARPEAKWLGCMVFVPSQLRLGTLC
jgi:putative ABC transport system ATP-binding protein